MKRILLVDDEPAFTSLLRANLENTGRYRVREVNEPGHTLASACEFRPDVILLDVSMPELDGGEVASQLRDEPRTKDVPIIFLTALVGSEEAPVGGVISGGHRFLSKPVSVAEVIECIENSAGAGIE
jgi:CheY-like chemotaxis protein